MNDEQTIYISPEDDLTTVRERLEQVQSRNVTLVVPAQTQLRSHVSWKLLNVRARELGKEVVIVSSDPQVRSVAHAVKFQVAHSLEASQQGHARPTNRPTRTAPSRNTRNGTVTRTTRHPNEIGEHTAAGTHNSRNLRTIREQPASYRSELPPETSETETPASSTFGAPPRQSRTAPKRQNYDYPPYNATSSIHPLEPEQIDEDADMLIEDYEHARAIREAASRSEAQKRKQATDKSIQGKTPVATPSSTTGKKSVIPPTDTSNPRVPRTDPPVAQPQPAQEQKGQIEDRHTIRMSPLPEQHGNAFIEDLDADEPLSPPDELKTVDDIENSETQLIDPQPIEYIDSDDVEIPQDLPFYSGAQEPAQSRHPEQRRQGPRTSPSRATGYVSPGKLDSSRAWQEALENDDELPVDERATRTEKRSPTNQHGPTGVREPRAVQLPIGGEPVAEMHSERGNERHMTSRSNAQRSQQLIHSSQGGLASRGINGQSLRKARRQPIVSSRTTPPKRVPANQTSRPRHTRRIATVILIAGGLIAALLLLAFFTPSSTVTLTLATHSYSHSFTVTAASNPSSGSQIPARTITQSFTRQGNEPATGNKMVDSGLAQGYVCFSNSGSSPITVPRYTIVTTATGVQFKVTAESVIIPGTTCSAGSAPDPIVAVQAGESGNVQVGAINTIPTTSLTGIAQYSNLTNDKVNGLKVTNLSQTSGGGQQKVAAITASDLQNARNTLHKQLQSDINVWLKSLPNNGIAGTPVITDSLVNPPAAGTTLATNVTTFQANVKVNVSVLFVDNVDLKEATIPLIENALQTDKTLQNYVVPNKSVREIDIQKTKIVKNATTTLEISYTAVAKVVPPIDTDLVRQLSSGQAPANARSAIQAKLPDVTHVESSTDPVLFPTIAFWQKHITVRLVPAN